MQMEQGEIAFWVLLIELFSAIGFMLYELNKDQKKSKKS